MSEGEKPETEPAGPAENAVPDDKAAPLRAGLADEKTPDSKFTGSPAPTPAKPKKKRKWLRRLLIAFALFPVFVLALWIAVHRIEWLGPWIADLGRSIFGNDAIAKLEDWAYGVQDKFNTATRGNEVPTDAWTVPDRPAPKSSAELAKQKYPDFQIKDVGPMIGQFAAPSDGKWVPMPDWHYPEEPAPMYKTLLHPDGKRAWSKVAVVAVDLRQVRLHLVAGTMEPMTKLAPAKAHKRSGLIPPEDLPSAIAAFNGGFKTTHGNYGMKSEGVLWVEPHDHACAIALYPDDVLKIHSWEKIAPTQDDTLWFRETPMCMYEDGEMHKGLAVEDNTYWGATLDKDTVIRRSAIGLSEDEKTMFMAISESTTAASIAKAMHFAGAHQVAQLDVNWSYPKFVTVEQKSTGSSDLVVKAIMPGFEFSPDDYVKKANLRDFFYLTRATEMKRDPASAPAPASSAQPTPSSPPP